MSVTVSTWKLPATNYIFFSTRAIQLHADKAGDTSQVWEAIFRAFMQADDHNVHTQTPQPPNCQHSVTNTSYHKQTQSCGSLKFRAANDIRWLLIKISTHQKKKFTSKIWLHITIQSVGHRRKRQCFVQICTPQKFQSSDPHKHWQVEYFKVYNRLKVSKLIQTGPFYTV